jgi:extracellular factor (EF) 3-hydroxypalmitic acid methyl ester biosynthesis protein
MWGTAGSVSDKAFFDQTLTMIDNGQALAAVPLIVGHLYRAYVEQDRWIATKRALHQHPLHARLLLDPYVARAAQKPRGYAGDAELIEMAYNQVIPSNQSRLVANLFFASTAFQASEGVRQRRHAAERFLFDAMEKNQRICVLACGHLREADGLKGRDLSNITAVDQDALSLARVRQTHGETIRLVEANVISFLRNAARKGEKFDLIYTLGLTDYLDDRAMRLLHKLMAEVLAPAGTIRLANFVPYHLAIGWMDAVMDWHLIYRTEEELAQFAEEAGFHAKTWIDVTGSIAWCEMQAKEWRAS